MTHRHHEIDYIEFSAPQVADSRKFYESAFGWKFTEYAPTYLGIAGESKEQGGICHGEAATTLVVLYSKNLDATLTAVKEAGGEITKEPFAFPGGRRFHFRDPSGTELAVWSS